MRSIYEASEEYFGDPGCAVTKEHQTRETRDLAEAARLILALLAISRLSASFLISETMKMEEVRETRKNRSGKKVGYCDGKLHW